MVLRNEREMALHAFQEAGLAEIIVIKLKALVTDADKRRLVAAVAGDVDADKGVLLSGRLLPMLLFLLLQSGFRNCHCRLNKRLRVDGKGQVSFALHLNAVVLRAVGGDADAALAGARH